MSTKQETKPENSWLNLIFNIILPVLILNKLTKFIGPLAALLLALAFPLAYGAYDLAKRKKVNALSALGLLNVALTGGLALMGIHGFWFAVKEAAFPTLVGLFVLGSAFTKKPFIEAIFLNPGVMKVDLLEEKLKENGKQQEFHDHLRKATMWLSLSFVFSAVCNFVLARKIFLNIDSNLTTEAQSVILNEQIAKMTTWSMAIIMVPSMIFLMGIFWYLMRGVKQYSGLSTDDLMKT
ncbi:VC0807 family protein [Bdellovibrio svalbardensis]|uniref:MFS transporter n=1 Tax=Bdellovibrio svalbardensis TaxID=2972972 RepID=A0ABT6DJI5_9BACT|nr:VC0807 family protein [Bdellovibrio svalbardensis]MDG0816380.1 hypothetical protein [Bdellovibrio svalbardensis]